MSQINCEDCLRTYRTYSYGIALSRVLMYGFSDWWEFEDEWVTKEQFREYWRSEYVKDWIIRKTTTYRRSDSFVEDFNFYYRFLENKRRKNISATFLCFDCEKYFCTNCVSKHSGHFTCSKDDKYNISKLGRISTELLEKLKAKGKQKIENMKRERILLHDVVDLSCEKDAYKLDFIYILDQLVGCEGDDQYMYELMLLGLGFQNNPRVEDLHILNYNTNWLVTDHINNCIKIFNAKNHKMTRRIKLSSSPHSITDIPSTDSSPCLIAVSFPWKTQIHIMNIHSTPAKVVSSISVQGWCEDLAYSNNKLITRYRDNLGGKERHSIHVMKLSGEIINIIDLHNLPGFKLERQYCSMTVHSESETIYLCHAYNPSCVISLSLDGQVLHSVTFTDLEPELIHVDKDQNVYVMSKRLPLYKLSVDLRQSEKITYKDADITPVIQSMRVHNDKLYLASDSIVYLMQLD